jgi:hypothetical protein
VNYKVMNDSEEREAIAALLAKRDRGEKLADNEEAMIAMSKYGDAGGCAA